MTRHLHPNLHPGEGRGPVGKAQLMKRRPPSQPSPTWPPASAGVVQRAGAPPQTPNTASTPAKAGAQLERPR